MKNRILIVEDHELNRELLSDWLEVEGFCVVAATTLDEAYAAFANQLPQVVLLDVQLGLEDGLELAAWIRKQAKLKSIPVIAVTAHAMVTDHTRVIEAGCDACVPKPIDFNLLSRTLRIVLPDIST